MRQLELLAPARDIQIGIAAIDCGADAVYIAGPQFGARQAAGNSIDDIRELCGYAHKFGARIFVALNTILYDDELEAAYRQMLAVQDAEADALIVQDMATLEMVRNGIGGITEKINIPLHASTQCAIRTPEQAAFLESLGFSRLILERELSLEQIRKIREAVSCELEFFVHGALCVCYSGQCYLSEKISGRSANRGACIQACRSRYDLTDKSGKIIVRDKALLSLKDYNLKSRIDELAEAGITSFKIEGRLKNISYVKNVVRDYSTALDALVCRHPEIYERGSFGTVTGGFTPDTSKTFNRGYTELFLDGKRGKWAAMDAAKSMGEEIGRITGLNKDRSLLTLNFLNRNIMLNNGDGFSFVTKRGDVCGFRGDICQGNTIRCKSIPEIFNGAVIYRNINTAFEKELEKNACTRIITASISVDVEKSDNGWTFTATAESEDGRKAIYSCETDALEADNQERMAEMIKNQLNKNTDIYSFHIKEIRQSGRLPLMKASFLNSVRRELAMQLDSMPCNRKSLLLREIEKVNRGNSTFPQKKTSYKNNISNKLSEAVYTACGAETIGLAYELTHTKEAELMRTKYCIRYELGICPKHHGCKETGPLFLLNNGQKFTLRFDCRSCEMILSED